MHGSKHQKKYLSSFCENITLEVRRVSRGLAPPPSGPRESCTVRYPDQRSRGVMHSEVFWPRSPVSHAQWRILTRGHEESCTVRYSGQSRGKLCTVRYRGLGLSILYFCILLSYCDSDTYSYYCPIANHMIDRLRVG